MTQPRARAVWQWPAAVQFWSLSILLLTSPALAGEHAHFDPKTGYRISQYRSPVDPVVPGGTRIFIEDLDKLVGKRRALLIDVMPSDGAGLDPETGAWHMTSARQHIPGSVWLPDVGKGDLTADLASYFQGNLERLTGGDKDRVLILYCQSDCWMGWNAIKRAAEIGYRQLYWYADGTDGWRDFDRPFEAAVPVPLGASVTPVREGSKP